jgi:hypothetical protein
VRKAQRPHRVAPAALQAFEQILAKPRVAAQHTPIRAPAHRQACRAQRREPLPGLRDAERLGARSADLVEQGCRDQEFAVLRLELAEDVGGEIAVQRVGFAAHAGDVSYGAPDLEQHTGHPAACSLDGGGRVDLGMTELRERLSCLGGRERQVRLAEGRDRCGRRQRPQRGRDRPAADQHEPHAARRVPRDRSDHGPRVAGLRQAFELIEDEHHRRLADRLDEQPGRLGVRDPGGQRPRSRAAHVLEPTRQRRLQVGHQPPRGGIGGIEGEPRDRPLQPARRAHHRRRLPGARRRGHHDEPIAFDEPGETALQPGALDVPLR